MLKDIFGNAITHVRQTETENIYEVVKVEYLTLPRSGEYTLEDAYFHAFPESNEKPQEVSSYNEKIS